MSPLILLFALFRATVAQFSATAQSEILQVHNEMRSAIALGTFEVQGNQIPSAANMIKLRWGKSLAEKAQEYANTCELGPIDPQFGVNTYRTYSQTSPTSLNQYGKKAAMSWANEFEYFGLESNFFGEEALESGIEDASQMVWALTSSVGCGVANCGQDMGTFTKAYKIDVVCLYMRKGNIVGEEIYEGGESCSACTGYYSCDEDTGLCG